MAKAPRHRFAACMRAPHGLPKVRVNGFQWITKRFATRAEAEAHKDEIIAKFAVLGVEVTGSVQE